LQSSDALKGGKNLHRLVEAFFNGEIEIPIDPKVGAGYEKFIQYFLSEYGTPIVETEQRFELDFGYGKKIIGFLDLLIPENGEIIELKFQKIPDLSVIRRSWQSKIYRFWGLLNGYTKYTMIAIKKPGIRQKIKETEEEFYQRLLEDITITTETVYIDNSIFALRAELVEMFDYVKQLHKGGIYPKNNKACKVFWECQFLPLCQDGCTLFYEQKTQKELKKDAR